MKKIFIITIVLLAIPGFALALGPSTGTVQLNSTSANVCQVTMSNQVNLYYLSAGLGVTFAVGTYHAKGDRSFASTSEDAVIYWISGTGNQGYSTAPGVGTSGPPSASWSTL